VIFKAQAGTLADATLLATMSVRGNSKIVKPSDGAACVTATANLVDIGCFDRCVTIRASAAADVIEPGSVAIPADRLFKLVTGFAPDAMITMADGVITRGDTSRYKLATIPIGDLPELAAIDDEIASITLTGEDVLTLLEPVVAADDEAMRQYLNSVFLQTVDDDLVATSTNGTRLIQTAVKAAPFAPGRDLVLPEPSAITLRKIIRQIKPPKVVARRSKSLFAAATPEFTLTTKLIDCQYPDLQSVIPAPTGDTVTLERSELKGVLIRLAAAATDAVSLIVLDWSHDAPLEIYLVRQPDAGADLIDADTKGAARIVVPLHGLATLIEEIKGEYVEITATNPIRIRATDNACKFALLCVCHWNFNESS
jgi:DNA polymerase III sliding clamp (beta) subunit (PCNA family)